jgi:hypothetical protein
MGDTFAFFPLISVYLDLSESASKLVKWPFEWRLSKPKARVCVPSVGTTQTKAAVKGGFFCFTVGSKKSCRQGFAEPWDGVTRIRQLLPALAKQNRCAAVILPDNHFINPNNAQSFLSPFMDGRFTCHGTKRGHPRKGVQCDQQ